MKGFDSMKVVMKESSKSMMFGSVTNRKLDHGSMVMDEQSWKREKSLESKCTFGIDKHKSFICRPYLLGRNDWASISYYMIANVKPNVATIT